jgi:hypothetical protein
MKKITYLLLIITSFCFAQFNVTDLEGNIIQNNSEITFNEFNVEDAKLKFKTVNTAENSLDIRIRCTGITNADGNSFQLCYGGLCYDNVAVNGIYPDFQNIIAPGQDNGISDYFLNNFGGNGNTDLIYSFRVFAFDLEGNVVGQSINLSYRYSPEPLSNDSFEQLSNLGINLKNTISQGLFEVQSSTKGAVSVFSLNGQLVQNVDFQEGNFTIDLSAFQSNYYLINFATNDGKTASIKVLKK